MAGIREGGNEDSVSVIRVEILDYMSNPYLLRKSSAPWSWSGARFDKGLEKLEQ